MKKKNIIFGIYLSLLVLLPSTVMAACGNETTACGWTELNDGNMIGAAMIMFDSSLAGWAVAILFFVYQFILLLKTRNLTLSWVTGALFAGMFVASKLMYSADNPVLKPISAQVIFALLVIELAAIIYLWLWK